MLPLMRLSLRAFSGLPFILAKCRRRFHGADIARYQRKIANTEGRRRHYMMALGELFSVAPRYISLGRDGAGHVSLLLDADCRPKRTDTRSAAVDKY